MVKKGNVKGKSKVNGKGKSLVKAKGKGTGKAKAKAKNKAKLVALAAGCALIWLGAHSAISQASTTAKVSATSNAATHTTAKAQTSSKVGNTVNAATTTGKTTPSSKAGSAGMAALKGESTSGLSAGTTSGSTGLSRPATTANTDALAEYVETAFQASGGTMDGFEIHNWSQNSQKYESSRQIQQIVDSLGKELQIQNAKKITHQDAGDGHSAQVFYELYGTLAEDTDIAVTASSFRFGDGLAETILIVRADSTGHSFQSFNQDVGNIRQSLQSIGAPVQISACIEGFRDARMSDGQEDSLVQQTFASVHANKVEGVQSSEVTSISGYSTLLPQYILTGNQKMNIQVGLHYDSVHRRTNVVVGAPIITVTY